MTLKDLCRLYRQHSSDQSKCCNDRTNFLIFNKGAFHFEELSIDDVSGLREYLLCDILSIYEYLADLSGTEPEGWIKQFDGVVCRKEENDDYIGLKELSELIEGSNPDAAFEIDLEQSIEQFRKRGIACKEFDYTV